MIPELMEKENEDGSELAQVHLENGSRMCVSVIVPNPQQRCILEQR